MFGGRCDLLFIPVFRLMILCVAFFVVGDLFFIMTTLGSLISSKVMSGVISLSTIALAVVFVLLLWMISVCNRTLLMWIRSCVLSLSLCS